jgi:hypothetical protein
LPVRELSTALNLMNQRVFVAAYAGEQPAIPEPRVLDTLVHIWTSSLYNDQQPNH